MHGDLHRHKWRLKQLEEIYCEGSPIETYQNVLHSEVFEIRSLVVMDEPGITHKIIENDIAWLKGQLNSASIGIFKSMPPFPVI